MYTEARSASEDGREVVPPVGDEQDAERRLGADEHGLTPASRVAELDRAVPRYRRAARSVLRGRGLGERGALTGAWIRKRDPAPRGSPAGGGG